MIQKYCLDTSFFINSWSKVYPRKVFPGYWAAIGKLIQQEVVFSCEEVFHELKRKEDDLYAWAVDNRQIFEAPTDDTIDEVLKVMARFPNFAAAGGSKNAADPWVIAHAKCRKAVIVTDEHRSNAIQKPTKPPKIPNVCAQLGIKCIGIVDFLGANSISF